MKIILLIGLFLILLNLAFAQTQIEISTDNNTWVNVTSGDVGGKICESGHYAVIPNLHSQTQYYIRAKDNTTSWAYLNQSTEGDMTALIGIMFLLGIIILGLIITAITLYKNKLVFIISGASAVGIIALSFHIGAIIIGGSGGLSLLYRTDLVNILDTLYGIFLNLFIFLLGLGVVYTFIISLVAFKNYKKRNKEKMWGEEDDQN